MNCPRAGAYQADRGRPHWGADTGGSRTGTRFTGSGARCRVAIAVAGCALLAIARLAGAQTIPELEAGISRETRLLVIAPHPDDETLGAAGLIQRVRTAGGSVRVVVMTSGDALREGVELVDRTTSPTALEFRRYGRLRELESERAMALLGLRPEHVTFLGFPDDGLCQLASRYLRSRSALESPYTHRMEPPASERFVRGVTYRGVDVRRELAGLVRDFQPTVVVLPDSRDEHPDHCAAHIFGEEAVELVGRDAKGQPPRLLYYLVHFRTWPLGPADSLPARLESPAGFPDPERWRSLTLTPREADLKQQALLTYTTQTRIMKPFMTAFARQNELYLEGNPQVLPECWCEGTAVAADRLPGATTIPRRP